MSSDPNTFTQQPIRLNAHTVRRAEEVLKTSRPELFGLIVSQETVYRRLSLLAQSAFNVACIVWSRKEDPHRCTRCGLNLHEPPTREELKGLDRGAE